MTTRQRPLLLLAVVVTTAGCASKDRAAQTADEYLYDCDNKPPGVQSFTADESFVDFIEREAAAAFTVDEARAARLSAPAAGGALSAAMPPQFVLQAPLATREMVPAKSLPRRRPSRWATMWRAVAPVGTAWAHCPAVNGVNYLFRLEDAGTPVYTALLSVTTFTPNAGAWRKALEGRAGKTLTLTLARAVFGDGDIRQGPFVAATRPSFTVTP